MNRKGLIMFSVGFLLIFGINVSKGDIVVNMEPINMIKTSNSEFYEKYDLQNHGFTNIVDEKLVIHWWGVILSFEASMLGDSLHEFEYYLEFSGEKLVKVKENYK